MMLQSSTSLQENWLNAVREVVANGEIVDTRIGLSKECSPFFITCLDPRQRFIFSRPYNIAFGYAELLWIMKGDNHLSFLEFWNPRMKNYSDDQIKMNGAYGHRIRKNFGFDQFEAAYKELKSNPNSRQVVIQIWDPNKDFPISGPVSKDVACTLSDHLLIRNGRLNWLHSMRSNDLFWGTPYDILVFTCIQEIMAGWLGIQIGKYTHVTGTTQIYEAHWDTAEKIAQSSTNDYCENQDDLRLSYEDFHQVLEVLWQSLVTAISIESFSEIESLFHQTTLPQPYQNIFVVMISELFCKKGFLTAGRDVLAECTNQAQRTVALSWIASRY